MLAARLNVVDRRLIIDDVPTPVPGPGQVRIAVRASGVCLSDVHLVQGLLTPVHLDGDVVTLGHEVAGIVDALGPGSDGWTEGRRVIVQAGRWVGGRVLTMGADFDGGWAEFLLAGVESLVPIPDDLPFEQAAIIPDAVSTPWAAITTTGRVRPGEAAGVWGVGGLGSHAVRVLRMIGAAPVVAVDPHPAARERAVAFGADVALDSADDVLPERIREITGGRGLAAAFDFAGVGAVREQAIRCLGTGGRLVLVGLTPEPMMIDNPTLLSFMGQQVRGHYGSGVDDLGVLVELVRHGRLELSRSISDVLPLDQAAVAVDRLERKEGDPIRLVLRP
ncbi:zinc-binding dehydrogenase [Microlunatus sp. Gsoil 973]|uniref:zinc-binding dehydrogenase n=1 Tax=Microlunatus sp. Gsoil 973 TaxID=2672569 RepID=UPI0012B4F2D2|nr:zinc-binding dehydrogenase [Microlunatus sp. Gsoil 973]QGN33011.1 zinc-binding dehydrogenase [Microlunatus sp. Gsoil 973]